MFGNPILLGLVIALALSMAGNAFVGSRWLAARDRVAAVEVERNNAINTAGLCSKSVSDMQTRATASVRATKPMVVAAQARGVQHDKRADEILSVAPTTPDDQCKSAQDQVRTWLQGRTQ